MSDKLPSAYKEAKWRNTMPADTEGFFGLGLTMESGEVLRFALDQKSAVHIAETLACYLVQQRAKNDPALQEFFDLPGAVAQLKEDAERLAERIRRTSLNSIFEQRTSAAAPEVSDGK